MQIDRDVAVRMRATAPPSPPTSSDPRGPTRSRVIASFGPYGKDVHWPDRYPLYDLVDNNEHMVWETPNS